MKDQPDPKALRRAMEQVDQLKRELRAERIRSGHLKFELLKARRTLDAKPPPDQHAC